MATTKVRIPVYGQRVRVSVYANSSAKQDVTITVPGGVPFVVPASTKDGHVNTTDFTPKKGGDWEFEIKTNGKDSKVAFARLELANSLNVVVIGSEDGVDMDFNDTVCIIQWPVG